MPIYTYDPTLNPAYCAPTEEVPAPVWTPDAIPGVPVRDLDAEDLRGLPARLRASVAVCPFYVLADASALVALEAELSPPAELLGSAAESSQHHRPTTVPEEE